MQYGLHVRTFWTALSVFIQVLQLTWEYCCLFLEKLDATLQRKFFLHWLNQHVYQFSSKMDKKTRKQRDSSLFLMWKTVARIMRKHNVPVAMKPYKTLKTVLVHPKDKQEKEDLTECVYEVPCWVRFGQCWVRFGQFRSDSVNCRTDFCIVLCPSTYMGLF